MLRSRLENILNVAHSETSCLGSLGRVGKKSDTSGAFVGCGLADGLFEQLAGMFIRRATRADLKGFIVPT